MGEPTSVDTDQMYKVLPQVDEIVRKLTAVHNGLVAGAGPLEDAAGDDAAGRAFRTNYTAARDQVVGPTGDLLTITGSINDRVNMMIGGYDQTEEDNTVKVPSAETPAPAAEHVPTERA